MTKLFLNAMSTATQEFTPGRDYCSFIPFPSFLRQTWGYGLGFHKLRRMRPAPYLTVGAPAQSHRTCNSYCAKSVPTQLLTTMAMSMTVIQMMKQNWSFWPLQTTENPNGFDDITSSVVEATVSDLWPICATILSWRWWLCIDKPEMLSATWPKKFRDPFPRTSPTWIIIF